MSQTPIDNPKPVTMLQDFVKWFTNRDDTILDFFAGSATTAHAVMQLNAEDGGKRKFIMVQLPEACDEKSEAFKAGYNTIAEISKERIRRAGKKIKEENATTAPDLDTGFRVLKIDSSNMSDVYYAPDEVVQTELEFYTDNIKEDRTSEDLLFQVLLDWGVDLTLPITREIIDDREVFFVDNNALAACFDKNGKITEEFCKQLAERQPMRVVFRDSGFKDDSVKINVEQIFKLKSPHTDIMTI
jgi:adenine-specific DNA-methyltransferase